MGIKTQSNSDPALDSKNSWLKCNPRSFSTLVYQLSNSRSLRLSRVLDESLPEQSISYTSTDLTLRVYKGVGSFVTFYPMNLSSSSIFNIYKCWRNLMNDVVFILLAACGWCQEKDGRPMALSPVLCSGNLKVCQEFQVECWIHLVFPSFFRLKIRSSDGNAMLYFAYRSCLFLFVFFVFWRGWGFENWICVLYCLKYVISLFI